MSTQTDEAAPDCSEEILARIRIARTNLYVFGEGPEAVKWRDLLDDAMLAAARSDLKRARMLAERVERATSALWDRIERWRRIQNRLAVWFGALLIIVIALVVVLDLRSFPGFNSTVRVVTYGLVGSLLSVCMSLGGQLDIGKANRLALVQTLLRPAVGVTNAVLAYLLLLSGVLEVGSALSAPAILSLVCFFAGYSERFVLDRVSGFWK